MAELKKLQSEEDRKQRALERQKEEDEKHEKEVRSGGY